MNFIMHAETLKKNNIYLANTFCFVGFFVFTFSSIKTVVLVSLKIAFLDKGVLDRLFLGY